MPTTSATRRSGAGREEEFAAWPAHGTPARKTNRRRLHLSSRQNRCRALAEFMNKDGPCWYASLSISLRHILDECGLPPHTSLRHVSIAAVTDRCRPGWETRMRVLFVPLTAALMFGLGPARAQQHPMPDDAAVYIIWPRDHEVIRGAFWIRMGLANAGIAPAGVE